MPLMMRRGPADSPPEPVAAMALCAEARLDLFVALGVIDHATHRYAALGCIVVVCSGVSSMLPAFRPRALLRREALREALPGIVDLLARRRAVDIEVGYIDYCLALKWLEWYEGALRLTPTGSVVCKEMTGRLA